MLREYEGCWECHSLVCFFLQVELCLTHIFLRFSYGSYLIVKEDKTLESYGLNAGKWRWGFGGCSDLGDIYLLTHSRLCFPVCTHLGCVVPWSAANNKFMCPCHGSQYAPTGAVVRGPAPLPLALAHCDVEESSGKILFSPWTETDFRTGEKGWWN